jgi:hypothetical protein
MSPIGICHKPRSSSFSPAFLYSHSAVFVISKR